ncbi:MAG: hypothetical protein GC168_19350 [Candidatus Hydrogenedens sp.]|nr:hypothetical protein [Candidatus Hydrogenedens sp.]
MNETYEKLPGGYFMGGFLAGRQRGQLWLGSDHLLHLRLSAYSEEARRIFLRDIELITVSPSRDRAIGTAIMLCMVAAPSLLLFGLALGIGIEQPSGAFFMAFATALSGGGIGYNVWFWLQGPIGRVHVHTRVNREELLALRYLRKADAALEILLPKIAEAQGRLEETPALQQAVGAFVPARSGALRVQRAASEKPVFQPGLHYLFFGYVILGEVFGVGEMLAPDSLLGMIGGYYLLAYAPIACVAIARQHRTNSAKFIRYTTWGIVALQSIQLIITAAVAFSISFNNPYEATDSSQVIAVINSSAWGQALTLGFAAMLSVLSLLGILELRRGGQEPPTKASHSAALDPPPLFPAGAWAELEPLAGEPVEAVETAPEMPAAERDESQP